LCARGRGFGDFTGRAPPILVQSYNFYFKEHSLFKEKWQVILWILVLANFTGEDFLPLPSMSFKTAPERTHLRREPTRESEPPAIGCRTDVNVPFLFRTARKWIWPL